MYALDTAYGFIVCYLQAHYWGVVLLQPLNPSHLLWNRCDLLCQGSKLLKEIVALWLPLGGRLSPLQCHERKTINYSQSSFCRVLENTSNNTILLKEETGIEISLYFPKESGQLHPKHPQDHLLPLGELAVARQSFKPLTYGQPVCVLSLTTWVSPNHHMLDL